MLFPLIGGLRRRADILHLLAPIESVVQMTQVEPEEGRRDDRHGRHANVDTKSRRVSRGGRC